MNRLLIYLTSLLLLTAVHSYGQKFGYHFEDPVVTDYSSTVMIPIRYNKEMESSSKMVNWGDYYANIVFYNFTNDSNIKLFDSNTYIVGFIDRYSNYNMKSSNNYMTSKLLLYRVKNKDHNKNGKIDKLDPSILYISDLYGNNLRALTTENENVLEINLFEKQQMALIKIQRDQDGDGDFEYTDRDYYYIKLDLNTLTFGSKIEAK